MLSSLTSHTACLQARPARSPAVQAVNNRGSARLNEDHLLVGSHTFGVFDGASSLTPGCFHGMTGAWWAAFMAWSVFAREGNITLAETARLANRKIRQSMLAHRVNCTNKLDCWSTSAAVFRVSNGRIEWVQTGDSLVGVIHDDGQAELLSPYHNHDRETLGRMARLTAQGVEDVREAAMPAIRKVRERMNQDYGVLNGEQGALDFIRSGSVSTRGVRHVIALTDGMFPPHVDPEKDFDFNLFAHRFRKKGLDGVLADIRTREEADPHCRAYPRFKRHDDATAVALTLKEG
ncbi:protein phosphatase 2C domain-containing protein [Desulfoplanes sp. PS50]